MFIVVDINLFFAWYKIFFKFTNRDFLCWFLTCVFWINWISIHWYWNVSLGLIGIFIRDVCKQDIWILFPFRLVECGFEGEIYVIVLVIINWLNGCEVIKSMFSCWLLLTFSSVEEETSSSDRTWYFEILLSRLACKIQFLNWCNIKVVWWRLVVQSLVLIYIQLSKSRPKGTTYHWFNTLQFFWGQWMLVTPSIKIKLFIILIYNNLF